MPSIVVKDYIAVNGSPYTPKDAKKIGPVLHALADQGALTARDVVDAARSTNSPLYEYFEWDNKVAADLWRVETARRMLRSIKIKYEEGGEIKETRAFQIIRRSSWENEPRKYRTFQVLHGDSAFAAQMMDSAIEDLLTWRRKYEPYVSLWKSFGDAFQQVINQVSELEEECKAENIAGETDEALEKLLVWREECSAILTTWTGAREQIEYIFKAIGNAETVFAKVGEKKPRICLRCGNVFVSVSVGNRICKSCLNLKSVNNTTEYLAGEIAHESRK